LRPEDFLVAAAAAEETDDAAEETDDAAEETADDTTEDGATLELAGEAEDDETTTLEQGG